MHSMLNPQRAAAFHEFGAQTAVHADGRCSCPGAVAIGDAVRIDRGYSIAAAAPGPDGEPRIRIGRGCRIGESFTLSATHRIELEPNAVVGRQVVMYDAIRRFEDIGIPVMAQGIAVPSGRIVIGEGAVLEDRVVIAGNVRIGRGSVVRAGSLVEADVPDDCEAEGVPAQIVCRFRESRNRGDGPPDPPRAEA